MYRTFICLSHLPFFPSDLCSSFVPERANLPRNMIENSMFEEEPDVVDLAKDSTAFPVRSLTAMLRFKDLRLAR